MSAIVLVGPMGVGKTTIGKKLAKVLGWQFLDTDQMFTKKHGDISAFFTEQGESQFRDIEEELVASAIAENAVVATGGGAVLRDRTRTLLGEVFVVYLATDGRHMRSRLSGGNRPLLKNGIADWRRIYESRKHLYQEVATITVDTSESPLAKIIDEILEGYKSHERK